MIVHKVFPNYLLILSFISGVCWLMTRGTAWSTIRHGEDQATVFFLISFSTQKMVQSDNCNKLFEHSMALKQTLFQHFRALHLTTLVEHLESPKLPLTGHFRTLLEH